MIEAWNERVHGDDTVYIVGDMYLVQKRQKQWRVVFVEFQ